MSISAERVRELFHYDQDTGVFTRRVRTALRTKVGDIVGSKDTYGYLQVKISEKMYLLHRLAWLYVYGSMPKATIDHIDRCKTNNSISNLRDVSRCINMRNTPTPRNNESGYKGVHYRKDSGNFYAFLTVNRKRIHLGCYNTLESANSACELARYMADKYGSL
ncbi:Uncharacterised protein [Serratia grimesii]|uniref:HNH endonuclease signature motif containing protein n=1 Tax=Serratia grimesii TaxID=82995 RepID=UPI00217A6263|nr:Uncharacterised protein [Serratia grimesii]